MPYWSKGANNFEELRRKAESLLQEQSVDSSQYPADIQELIQELKVHQTELEIQNDELKRSQEEQGNLHREYEDLYEFAPCGYLTLSSQGTITKCNLTGVKLLGVERGNLKSMALSAFVTQASQKNYFSAFQQARQKGEQQTTELELSRQDTETAWVQANIQPHQNEDGSIEQWRITLSDITELKLTEQKLTNERSFLSTVLDNIREAIVVCDKEGRLVRFNEVARRLHGIPEQPIPPKQWPTHYDLYQPDGYTYLPMKEIPLYRALQGEYLKDVEIVVAPKHEAQRCFICSGQPLIEAGEINGAVVIMYDITERKQLEQLKEDVDRIARHDLKTPLNGIVGLPQVLLSEENLYKEQKVLIEHIQQAGYRMLNMINMSLYLYQMEKGEYDFHPQPTDVISIVQDIQRDLSSLCSSSQNNISVSLEGTGQKDAFVVSGEKLLCYTMLSNLIKNAVEKTPAGETVHIQLEEPKMNQAKITIHNPGMIPKQIQAKIGQKYATAEKQQATGLGVYSARLIAQTMNGSLTWSSSEESGTYFTVYLPMPEQAMRKLVYSTN